MQKIPLTEAESCLAELVKEATNGEEIIITQTDGSAVKARAAVATINQHQLREREGSHPSFR